MLALRDVCGAILAYLEQREARDALDAAFREDDTRFEALKRQAEAQRPAFYSEVRERISRARPAQKSVS